MHDNTLNGEELFGGSSTYYKLHDFKSEFVI